jgi:hypothetical protein
VNLIVVADLTTNEGLYFRYLTMMAESNVVVETTKPLIDYHYKNLKSLGLYDYVDDMVTPECDVQGIRIDTELNYPMTIQTNTIGGTNVQHLLEEIRQLKNIYKKI